MGRRAPEEVNVTSRPFEDTVDGASLPMPPAAVVPSEARRAKAERSESEAAVEPLESGVAPLDTEREARRRRRRRIISLLLAVGALTWLGIARTDRCARGQGALAARKWAPISTEAAGTV